MGTKSSLSLFWRLEPLHHTTSYQTIEICEMTSIVRIYLHSAHISPSIVEQTLVYVCCLAKSSIHSGFGVSSYLYAMYKSTMENGKIGKEYTKLFHSRYGESENAMNEWIL